MLDPILEMRGMTKSFHGVKALSDVNLTVHAGQIHAIVGENGAGKSTLMKVLSGVYPHGDYAGEIRFLGQECRFKSISDSEEGVRLRDGLLPRSRRRRASGVACARLRRSPGDARVSRPGLYRRGGGLRRSEERRGGAEC